MTLETPSDCTGILYTEVVRVVILGYNPILCSSSEQGIMHNYFCMLMRDISHGLFSPDRGTPLRPRWTHGSPELA